MKFDLEFSYFQSVIPPRCRKAREMSMTDSALIRIQEITPGDAPVAFEVSDYVNHDNKTIYRWHDERLWERWALNISRQPDRPYGRATAPAAFREALSRFYGRHTRTRVLDWLEVSASQSVLIGDELWREFSGEPVYVVPTFGFGGNHGGTALMVDEHYNPNIGLERYFRADQFELAQSYALAMAQWRGDTNDIDSLSDAVPLITVGVPAAIQARANNSDGLEDLRMRLAKQSATHAS